MDQPLPPMLAEWLTEQGYEAVHVRDLGLSRSSKGRARLIWVRMGNCRNAELLARFQASWPRIVERLHLGDDVVELR